MTLARIIRAERRGPTVVQAEVYAAQLEAAQVRAAAVREAAQLVAAAAADIERERAAGYARGHAEGTAQAARELLGIATARDGALREQERQLRELALILAGKLTAHAFEHEPAAIQGLIEPLLTRVRRARKVVIRAEPEAALFLRERLAQLAAAAELDGALEVVSDPAIERGGCVIESDLGELDARLHTRMDELARALGWESK
jgi:flagellar biosynthesis/type III secretory pathway protein FliH